MLLGGSMNSELIRVMLADDHRVVRTGLRAVLSAAKDIVVVAEVSSGREAIAMAERIPGARTGGIEVRPIMPMPAPALA